MEAWGLILLMVVLGAFYPAGLIKAKKGINNYLNALKNNPGYTGWIYRRGPLKTNY